MSQEAAEQGEDSREIILSDDEDSDGCSQEKIHLPHTVPVGSHSFSWQPHSFFVMVSLKVIFTS